VVSRVGRVGGEAARKRDREELGHRDAVTRRSLLLAIAALLVAATCSYRFLTMGGQLGGFDDDEFVVASYSQQLVLGDRPTRDFIEPGRPLQHAIGAVAQLWFGPTLFSQFAISVAMIAVSTAILFLLAERASGSIPIALAVALMQVALSPRYYNYPKLLAYAVAISAIWYYIDRPTRGRLVLIGAAGALAFLLRHDHGIYVALAGVAGIAVTHWPNVRRGAQETLVLGAIALAMVAPYLLYTQAYQRLDHYVRASIEFGQQSVSETEMHFAPGFAVDLSRPLVEKTVAPVTTARINVRWVAGLDERTRTAREATFGLTPDNPIGPDMWNYKFDDPSRERIQAIVTDPLVTATEGIDRTTMTIVLPPLSRRARVLAAITSTQLLPGIITEANAAAFLFYVLLLPAIAVLVLLLSRRVMIDDSRWPNAGAKIGVVAILAIATAVGLLRGNLGARIADASEVSGVVIAWLAAWSLARPTRGGRAVAVAVACVLLLASAASVQALEHVTTLIAQTGIDRGAVGVAEHGRDVYRAMTAIPPAAAWDRRERGIVSIANYVHACTQPDDRIVVLGYVPELFFLSHRGFGAGAPWTLPNYFRSDVDQRAMIARIESHRVPFVFTVPEPTYTSYYGDNFPLLDQFLRREYRDAGVIEGGGKYELRLLVLRRLAPLGSDPVLDLPCFA
jgi:hypothetical protein